MKAVRSVSDRYIVIYDDEGVDIGFWALATGKFVPRSYPITRTQMEYILSVAEDEAI